jgi:hypothetical protein
MGKIGGIHKVEPSPKFKPARAKVVLTKPGTTQPMYLKKVKGPRAVTLPDGRVMTRADLPDAETRRWVASRKAAVVRAIANGLITRAEALDTYHLSEEELDAWHVAVERHGESALKATSLQRYRQP